MGRWELFGFYRRCVGKKSGWDLIPRIALSSVALMPGSNPLFGLNTLGGALSIRTKDGRSDPGTSVQATFGSHLRRAIEFEHGGARTSRLNVTLAYANNALTGNGLQDQRFLERDYASVYTSPDDTNNRSTFLRAPCAPPRSTDRAIGPASLH